MSKKAELYRMVTDKHICPYGIKSKDLLQKNNYEVSDHHLKTREETDEFKSKHNVETTPQTFIDGKRIGGYDDLRKFFGKKVPEKEETSYTPIIAIFSMTFLIALALNSFVIDQSNFIKLIELFIAISMCFLAVMKLRDLYSFSNQFITYDILAREWVDYAYIYPFIEGTAGILMIAGVLKWLAAPGAFFIGTIGAISVFKAVYIEKRKLKCACVGGGSNVPLGFISLTENLMMIAMAVLTISN